MQLDTSNRSYRTLMGNGLIYTVPRFQRDYSWSSTEWDDLWQDIEILYEEDDEQEHYMGYLVLQSRDSKNFEVIDGQQRLTTLSILVLAVLGNLQRLIDQEIQTEKNQRRLDQLRSAFIGYLDPVTLVPKSKLTLNRNNNDIYQHYLVPLEPAPKRNLKASEHLMRQAYEWFYDKVEKRFAQEQKGEELAAFIDSLSDKLFFTVINVNDELNAYKVFETLNARGVQLSSTDLLKNYLFSVVHGQGGDEHELREIEKRWEKIVGLIESESLPDFLRAYWNSRNPFVRHAELFKRVRKNITGKREVFTLLRDIESNAHIFAALPNAEDALWEPEQRTYIRQIRMFNVRQLYPLLLAAYQKLSTKDFTKLLQASTVISFRYNVIGQLSPNKQERVYNKVAVHISSGKASYLQQILEGLRSLYVSDEKFKNDLADKVLRTTQSRNKRIVRYLLFRIENQLSGKNYDHESAAYNLEHIMPESLGAGWEHISDKGHEHFLYRLGNLTLLNKKQNRDLANAAFEEKQAVFSKSEFHITRRIAEQNETWDTDRIAAHQKWLARQATGIWKIPQLED